MFFVKSKEECRCPKCGGELVYRDMVKRYQKKVGGERDTYMINRMKCLTCGKLHRQLTMEMLAFKQYYAEIVEDVQERVITENDAIDYPSIGTMKQWRKWFDRNLKYMEKQLKIVSGHIDMQADDKCIKIPLDFGWGFTESAVSLLSVNQIRDKRSHGWLGFICSVIINAGGRLFSTKMVPAEEIICTDFCS